MKNTGNKNRDLWSDEYIRTRIYETRGRAHTRMLDFDLTFDDLKRILNEQDWRCHYTGIKFTNDPRDRYNWSIDRKDSNLGYTLDNVVACCMLINMQKGAIPYDDFISKRWELAEMNQKVSGSPDKVTHFDAWADIIAPYLRWARECQKEGWNTSLPRAGRGAPYVAPLRQSRHQA